MKLSYGTLLSPEPIKLSIGTINHPTLKEISKVTFEKFNYYELLLKLTPKIFYTKMLKENGGVEYWESLAEDEQYGMDMFSVINNEDILKSDYIEMFNFFFKENVGFLEDFFILSEKQTIEEINKGNISMENICGVISAENLTEVLNVLQQVCCLTTEEEKEKPKFKNKIAEKIYKKIHKEDESEKNEVDPNFEIENIISKVSNRHPTISPITVWDLTVFQLIDSFKTMQTNSVYDIEATRVSVWGDEKNTFDSSLWYKNNFRKSK